MPPQLIIFDCDGVLVDSEILANRVMSQYLTEFGHAISPEACLARFVGTSLTSVKQKIDADAIDKGLPPLPDDFAEQIKARDRVVFQTELKPIDGIAKAVRDLTCPCCVASSGPPDKIRGSLSLTGLLPLFDPHLFSAAMVAKAKPAPDLFLHAASEMGVAADQCIVIEDSPVGVLAAHRAGMVVIAFTGGSHAGGTEYQSALRAAGAETLFTDMARLGELLAF